MYNLLDLVTTVCCILELAFVTSALGAFEFEPWGILFIPYISRSVLRPFRVVVMGHFVSIQRVSARMFLRDRGADVSLVIVSSLCVRSHSMSRFAVGCSHLVFAFVPCVSRLTASGCYD